MQDFIIQTLQPLDEEDPLAIINLNINAQSQRSAFKEELVTYLQSVSLSYQDIRVRGSRPNKFLKEFLQPRVGDVCMYLDSKNKKRFGLINTVIDPS